MREHKEIGSKPVSYYYLRDKNLIIGTTMRAASSSMHSILEKRSTITQKRVLQLREQGMPVIIWFRNPFHRIASAYDIFKKNRTFGEFIEHATTVQNTHWLPQTTIHSYEGLFLPNKVIPFDDLNETWTKLMGKPLPILKNKPRASFGTLSKGLNAHQNDILLEYYGQDLDMYHQVQKISCLHLVSNTT